VIVSWQVNIPNRAKPFERDTEFLRPAKLVVNVRSNFTACMVKQRGRLSRSEFAYLHLNGMLRTRRLTEPWSPRPPPPPYPLLGGGLLPLPPYPLLGGLYAGLYLPILPCTCTWESVAVLRGGREGGKQIQYGAHVRIAV